MAIFSGCYFGLGVDALGGTLTELSGGSYARLAVSLTGSFVAGATQALSAFGAAAAPTGQQVRATAVFDSLTGGNQLCYWVFHRFPNASTNAFPASTQNFTFIGTIAASANISSAPVNVGAQIGTVNGNPLIASYPIAIVGGVFTSVPQSGVTSIAGIASTTTYANDAAAAAGGVALGSVYRNGSIIQVRVA